MADNPNTGKIAITVGSILGVLGIALGYYTYSSTQTPSVATAIDKKEIAVDALSKAEDMLGKLAEARNMHGPKMGGDNAPHTYHLFFSPEMWQVADAEKGENILVDIYKNNPNIHEGIENTWFIENGLKDIIGMSDAPDQDNDSDGFTNREEYLAKTNPKDALSHPLLIQEGANKVFVDKIQKFDYIVTVSSNLSIETPENAKNAEWLFKIYVDGRDRDRVRAKVGGKFGPAEEPERFVLTGFEQRNYNPNDPADKQTVAIVEDTMRGGKEKAVAIRPGVTLNGDRLFGTPNAKGYSVQNRTATLKITAGAGAGQTIDVREGATFKLPGDKDHEFSLESVKDDDTITVIPLPDGAPVTVGKQN